MFVFQEKPLEIGAMAKLPYHNGMEGATRHQTRFGDVFELGRRDGDFYYVPRNMVVEGGDDLRSNGYAVDLVCKVPPRNEMQQRIISQSLSLLRSGRNHIIQAGTGTGKTYLSLNIASQLKTTILVVVTKDNMMKQWRGEVKTFLGLTDDKIGTIQQNVCDVHGKPIVLGMLHSLCKDKYPDWVKDYFGIVIYDETHRLGAEYFSAVAGMFSSRYRLGLTATPKRQDGKELIFNAHIGPVGVLASQTMLNPKVIFVKTGYTLPTVVRRKAGKLIRCPLPVQPGKLMGLYKLMAADLKRNAMIVNFVVQAYHKGRHTVVFSELNEGHLGVLRPMLVQAGVKPSDIGVFTGTANKSTLEAQKAKRVVLTTYQMCAEAVNVPRWDTAVLALPRSNIVQIVGRILREHDEKAQPVVLDLVDDIKVLTGYYGKRLKQYQDLHSTIVHR